MTYFKKVTIIFGLCLTVMAPGSMNGQCKKWAQKFCDIGLGDYKSNGQLTVASLVPGEEAELNLIFYRKQDYRVILCAEQQLGAVEFSILNSKGEVLFTNKDFDMTQDWDFTMNTTQRLIIKVKAPGPAGELQEGCVNVTIGHRPTPKKGFY